MPVFLSSEGTTSMGIRRFGDIMDRLLKFPGKITGKKRKEWLNF